MKSKTKILVLHMKEVIYTGIFLLLGILFLILIFIMFSGSKQSDDRKTFSEKIYQPGTYTQTLSVGQNTLELEMVLSDTRIESIGLTDPSGMIETMYPLIPSSFEDIKNQILTTQSVDEVHYTDEMRYTSTFLLNAVQSILDKAAIK